MSFIDTYVTTPPRIIQKVTQNGHGFVVGDVLRVSGTNTYTKAQADSLANSRAVGIVSQVVNANEFVITLQGWIQSGIPAVAAGTVMYLSDSVAGALTSTAPSSNVNPILVVTENALSGIVVCSLVGLEGGGSGGEIPYGTTTGTNGYSATMTPTVTAYNEGDSYLVKFVNGNTSTSLTLSLDGLANVSIKKNGTSDPAIGDIIAGQIYFVVFDGTNFQLEGNIGGSGVTPSDLTKTDDTNVTLTLGGTPTGALLQAVSLTLGWTGLLSLARGGTNKNMTPVAGGIVWTDADSMEVIAAGTAGQVLVSGGSSAPTWADSELFEYITPGDGDFSTMSDTEQSITPLTIPVVANGVYRFEFGGKVGCDNTGGAQMSISMPAGAEAIWQGVFRTTGVFAGAFQGRRISSGVPMATFATANTTVAMALVHGMIQIGANAGNVIPQIRAVVSGQTVTVYEYAYFLLKRVA